MRNAARVLVTTRRGAPSGLYTVRWGVVSSDGHADRGTFRFRVRR